MNVLTRTFIEQSIVASWREKIERTLPNLLDTYPGNNPELLGRLLVVRLTLRKGLSGMKNGVFYQTVGEVTNPTTLRLCVLQPAAPTEYFDIDLTYYDNLFTKRKTEEWNK